MKLLRILLILAAAALAGTALALAFLAYQHPSMLIDFTNLVFCG